MQPTDAAPSPSSATARPRPFLLIGLGVVVVLFLLTQFWPKPDPPPAAAPRVQATTGQGSDGAVNPADLQVRLGALKDQRPGPSDTERNPFVFKPKPPPPPPPPPPQSKITPPPAFNPGPPQPPPPPPIPPIPLKFMGTVEGPFGKLGAFTDCKRTFMVREGEIVDGRYKVLKIGLESATLQYADGRGSAQTVRMTGQECVGK